MDRLPVSKEDKDKIKQMLPKDPLFAKWLDTIYNKREDIVRSLTLEETTIGMFRLQGRLAEMNSILQEINYEIHT